MKQFWRGITLSVAGAMVAIGIASPAQAQDDIGGVATLGDLESLEGLESAVNRTFSLDFENLDVTQLIDDEGNVTLDTPMVTSASIYHFDSEDNASAAFDSAQEDFNTELEEDDGSLGLEPFGVDDIGDKGLGFHGGGTDETFGEMSAAGILIQDDEDLILVFTVGIGEDFDSHGQVIELVEEIEDRDAGDMDSVEFHDDGTSSGGLWDLLPSLPEDDSRLATDVVLFPVDTDATADASPEVEIDEAA